MTPLSDSEAATVQRFEAAEPAPESWGGDGELRAALRGAIYGYDCEYLPQLATALDRLLALPELAALRAKADAADRVRAEVDALSRETGAFEASYKGWALKVVSAVRRALDGQSC